MSRESGAAASQRHALLKVLQEHYAHFEPFLEDGMDFLGFETTEIQKDIGNYMEFGPQDLMIQAQRSQAKTTIAALYAVWTLIHQPWYRVLIISAGGGMASDISTLIVRLVLNMPGLDCLRPDKTAGDRTSTENFDVHHSLKGVDKSASVKCMGVTANLQGNRADLLLCDDVESGKNAATAMQRAKLMDITRDFKSIVQKGRILWLGTPQTTASIYNSLPARGVQVRIWPGRYPTPGQREKYGNRLAPLLARCLDEKPELGEGGGMLGDQGQAIDPMLLNERALQSKELDQGEAYFQLQHMLNTALTDALRYPLKTEKLVVIRTDGKRAPSQIVRGMTDTHVREFVVADHSFYLTAPHELSTETLPMEARFAYIDPAAGGANADETAYSIGSMVNGNIILLACGGIPGGYDLEKMEKLSKLMAEYKVTRLIIEKNMGYGAFREVLLPVLRRFHQCQVDDDLVTGRKEGRIINTLAPIMGRGALIIDEDVVKQDEKCCSAYSPSVKQSYSLFFQLQHMTNESGSLVHDDRCDSLEGLCRAFQVALSQDAAKITQASHERDMQERLKDPFGFGRFKTPAEYLSRQHGAVRRKW
ncbi:hypothetical protein UFOVP60_11 [uncultured Caudovirales phage]|uniref:Terminase large subunit ribonuclease H-like domain-containing protein n=1 Tax=uncultured Caudovirales phage TaxID=2100421 RepID=A0A6J5TCK9_9CAUD|nr:hypothetical protein UFOVP60_11 [uncultured Caudovirales phage]